MIEFKKTIDHSENGIDVKTYKAGEKHSLKEANEKHLVKVGIAEFISKKPVVKKSDNKKSKKPVVKETKDIR